VRQAHWLYELEQMQLWERDYAPLTFIPVVQEPDADWTGRTGLVHKAIMDDFVSLHDHDIYVAGRFEMARVAREEFKILDAEPAGSRAFDFHRQPLGTQAFAMAAPAGTMRHQPREAASRELHLRFLVFAERLVR